MTIIFDPATLYQAATEAEIFDFAMSVADGVGLPTSTWQVGDPTRTGLQVLAARLALVDQNVIGYYASGFLSSARGAWLTLIARELFQVERGAAGYASGIITLKNSTTTKFTWEANGLTLKNISTGKSYKNSSTVTLLAGATLVFNYVAEEAGSGSTSLVDSIALQSTIKGVEVVTSSAAVGVDEQSDASLRAVCVGKVSGFSPNGAYQAYEAVATTPMLTGVSSCRKAQCVSGTIGTGTAVVYLGNQSALLTETDRVAVELALIKYATPCGFSAQAKHATLRALSVSGLIRIYPIGVTKEATRERAALKIQSLITDVPIGGGSGPGFTDGNVENLLINERVFQELERWSPGLVLDMTINSSFARGIINPGDLVITGSAPALSVTY